MRNLAGKARRSVEREPGAGERPDLREDVVLDEEVVLDLRVEARDETEFGFGATVGLDESAESRGMVCAALT